MLCIRSDNSICGIYSHHHTKTEIIKAHAIIVKLCKQAVLHCYCYVCIDFRKK